MAIKDITTIEAVGTLSGSGNLYAEDGDGLKRVPVVVAQDALGISELKRAYESGEYGISDSAKAALLACFQHVAWTDAQGQTYYNALYDALYPVPESITAVFTQGSVVVYDTDLLSSLRQMLVVTATYGDSSTKTVTSYTLSGTLTAGTSTITVTFSGVTTTFDVVVTHNEAYLVATYTQGGTVYTNDELSVLTSDLVVWYYADSETTEYTVLTSEQYTLSGTLTEGTSVVTVSYSGVYTTFTVTVTADPGYITAVYTQPQTTIYTVDDINDFKTNLVVTYFARPDSTGTVVASADYTLSGTLVEGTNVIAVTYGTYSTYFTVTGVVDYYDVWEWNSGTNAILYAGGSGNASTDTGYAPAYYAINGTRASLWVGTGVETIKAVAGESTAVADEDLYPIPVPDGATTATFTITPSTYYASIRQWAYSDGWTMGSQTGWKQGTGTLTLAETTGRYLNIAAKFNSSGTSGNLPTNITVTFA